MTKTIELDESKLPTAMRDGAAIRDLLTKHCGNCTEGRLRGELIEFATAIRQEERRAAFREAIDIAKGELVPEPCSELDDNFNLATQDVVSALEAAANENKDNAGDT